MPDLPTPADLLDLAYPYALDALSDEERRTIEQLLDEADEATAAEFRTTVRELRETLAAMTVVDAVPAPPELEARLQAALDAQLAEAESDTAPSTHDPAQDRPTSAHDSANEDAASLRDSGQDGPTVLHGSARGGVGSRFGQRMRWLAAAAAVVVAVGAGVGIAVYRSQSHTEGVTAQQVVEHGDARVETVPVTGGGTISVTASRELDAAVVSFDTVPAAPADRAYQLWLISGAQVRSGGVLGALPSASAPLLVRVGGADKLAVSLEPAGGSVAPTTDPIAGVPLT
ncbi:anti-sigma factor domain-containing protein [Nocardia blacklockiae]|uniref:anti-sigma factor n=1 Tax=Nocardia blacklockiae TaxID=480036 RepID=UPI001893FE58|nr:anti-sigma factor [Nocardia blacklockiae]MBF6175308.1 anti-sigma factor [Nocardia blacklockiae]